MSTGSPLPGEPVIAYQAELDPLVRQRFRVLLVRVHPADLGRVRAVMPGGRKVKEEQLPLVLRVTSDRAVAEETATRVRRAGGVVTIVEEPADPVVSAFCGTHTSRIAARGCFRCGTPTCSECVREADGEELCPDCRRKGRSPRYRVRLRQLFVLFLFAVFLYEVSSYLGEDRARVDPLGPVDVAVLQLAEPTAAGAPIVRALNHQLADSAVPSLYDVAPWFNAEHRRYTTSAGPYLRTHIRGPFVQDVRPPAIRDDHPLLGAWDSWRYARTFRQVALDYGIPTDSFAARVFVVYSQRAGDLAAESRGSAHGRMAVVWIAADERNPAYAVLTVAHELAHTLGAEDTYDPYTNRARVPEGLIEPYATPPYPQRYAELMAGDVPLTPEEEREVTSLDEVRIGYRTAARLRWIDREQADLYYRPPSLRADNQLPPSPGSAGGRVPAQGVPAAEDDSPDPPEAR